MYRYLKLDAETRHIPILMLTGKGEEIDRVAGFELGADHYVTQPFSPRELVLRVNVNLKRVPGGEAQRDLLQFGGLTIDVPRRRPSWRTAP